MAGPFPDAAYPAWPYPGARPVVSFVHEAGDGGGIGHPLVRAGAGWQVAGEPLAAWLAVRSAPPLGARHAVLAYGSNACPSKIGWLRRERGLAGPVVVLRAWTVGLAAVWAAGLRVVDDQRPATLAAGPGREAHALWLATDDQLAVLDACEGRGVRYELGRLPAGSVVLEDDRPVPDPLAYVGLAPARRPLLVDGAVLRCADVPQQVARTLAGVPATTDGIGWTPAGERMVR